jgi:two-component system NarL family sensor kinase
VKDVNDITLVITIGSVLLTIIATFIVAFFLTYRSRQQKHAKEKELLYSNFQQELLRTQLEIQEQTLKNISQEIHDNIGQTLSLAKLNLNTIDLQKENAEGKIVHSKELVSKAIHDLRNLSRSLNTDSILSSGLVKAIETELAIIEQAGSFKTEFNTAGPVAGIDPKKELILFRIVQEAINNILKHSGASRILVSLVFTGEALKIEISDDGNGFGASAATTEGQGLRNMKSRAELIGGTFHIQTNPVGTTITVTLPITAS